MDKFKVGDEVRCLLDKNHRCYFEGIKEIDFITTGVIYETIIGIGKYRYLPNHLGLACPFKRGELIEVSNYKNFTEPIEAIYLETINGAFNPIICVNLFSEDSFKNNKPFSTSKWVYARKIPEPEYKPYTEPKLEWVDNYKEIKAKGIEGFHTIYGFEKINGDWAVLIRDDENGEKDSITLPQMFEFWEWENRTVCGEEVK